ncbi:MAG: helix-turn-helix domain-containing protein [Acidimicrobiia bacterium]
MSDRWLTIDEAAAHIGVRPSTIRTWLREGRFPAFGSGHVRRIALSDFEEYLRRDTARHSQRRSA